MLSIAFKNGIIMLLIILIVHFLIKNYVVGKARPPTNHIEQPIDITLIPKAYNINVYNPKACDEPFVEIDESVPPMQLIAPTQAPIAPSFIPDDEELLKYVKSLDSNISFNSNTKKGTFCDIETTDVSIKKAKPIDPSTNSTPYFMLNSYDDENTMNGGHIFKNIDGFEETMMFSDYEKLT